MQKYMTVGVAVFCLFVCVGCAETKPQSVEIPLVATEAAPQPEKDVTQPKTKHSLGIIGAVEPVYFPPMKRPFLSRIDTGAENSSIDAQNIVYFEREGEKWVAFDLINRTGGRHHFEKRLYKTTTITRVGESEKRPVVMMTVKMGKETISALFSLVNREKFDYQALIGRNILNGRAIVDTSLSKTLY